MSWTALLYQPNNFVGASDLNVGEDTKSLEVSEPLSVNIEETQEASVDYEVNLDD